MAVICTKAVGQNKLVLDTPSSKMKDIQNSFNYNKLKRRIRKVARIYCKDDVMIQKVLLQIELAQSLKNCILNSTKYPFFYHITITVEQFHKT